jgi:lysophospholipid acyltransferase (LPLAT)-like uncharacterized protein
MGEAMARLNAKGMRMMPNSVALLIRLLHRSCHFTLLGQEYEADALRFGKSIIYTTWHFAFPGVVYQFRNRNGLLMVSPSRDGERAAQVLKHLGYLTVRGSTGKGGSMVLRRMVSHLQAGQPGGFIADGSRGPAQVAQKGILVLARHSQAPLVPVSMAANPCWRFRSWDRTLLAKPFSRVAIAFGPAIWVDAGSSAKELEKLRRSLQFNLNHLSTVAADHVGLPKAFRTF